MISSEHELYATLERMLDARSKRGASDSCLITWLEHIKSIWPNNTKGISGLQDAIALAPITGI